MKRKEKIKLECQIANCDLQHNSNGYCRKHIRRLRKYGDPLKTMKNMDHSPTCSKCSNKYYGNGLCRYHYSLSRIQDNNKFGYNIRIFNWGKLIKQDKSCVICGSTDRLQAHHLIYKLQYPELSLNENNGVPLCHKHHNETHGRLLI
jgi:hypothetical protein